MQIYNPLVSNSRTDTWILQLMYPRLMQMDANGSKVPALATKWGYEDGGRTARMFIRDDFSWSDGRKLTVDLGEEEQGLVIADCDMSEILKVKAMLDVHGHYSRPDLLWLGVDYREKEQVRPEGGPEQLTKA